MNIGQFSIHDDTDLAMSRFNSIVLLVLYFFYLVFTMSEPAEEKSEEKSKLVSAADEAADGEEEEEEDDDDEEEPFLSLSASLFWLVVATVVLAYLSELLSESVERAA